MLPLSPPPPRETKEAFQGHGLKVLEFLPGGAGVGEDLKEKKK